MNPELIERMEELAKWHDSVATLNNYTNFKPFHTNAAADIRAAIVSADEMLAALLKLSNSYAFIKPPGYPKSDSEKLADAVIAQSIKE